MLPGAKMRGKLSRDSSSRRWADFPSSPVDKQTAVSGQLGDLFIPLFACKSKQVTRSEKIYTSLAAKTRLERRGGGNKQKSTHNCYKCHCLVVLEVMLVCSRQPVNGTSRSGLFLSQILMHSTMVGLNGQLGFSWIWNTSALWNILDLKVHHAVKQLINVFFKMVMTTVGP